MKSPLQFNRFEFKAMGSPCEIRLYTLDAQVAANAVAAAVAEINRLETKYSRYKIGNFLYRVNQAAALGRCAEIDTEFASILAFADTCYQQSEGLFDITSGVLRKIWSFQDQVLPTEQQIKEVLEAVGWQHVSWTEQQIRFAKKGMEIDFGGIVKEYAADCAATQCEIQGIRHGIVDLGGDVKAIGPHPDGTPWSVNIRHPRRKGESLALFELSKGGLASSGDYERFIHINGKRYCHILSPKTGWPISGLAAVTVVAPQCVVAGSACTIAMLKGYEGPEWLKSLQLPFAWMDVDGNSETISERMSN